MMKNNVDPLKKKKWRYLTKKANTVSSLGQILVACAPGRLGMRSQCWSKHSPPRSFHFLQKHSASCANLTEINKCLGTRLEYFSSLLTGRGFELLLFRSPWVMAWKVPSIFQSNKQFFWFLTASWSIYLEEIQTHKPPFRRTPVFFSVLIHRELLSNPTAPFTATPAPDPKGAGSRVKNATGGPPHSALPPSHCLCNRLSLLKSSKPSCPHKEMTTQQTVPAPATPRVPEC